MNNSEKLPSINITIIYEGSSYLLTTNPNEYRNLMMLILNQVSSGEFGECMGMGKCATCLVDVSELDSKTLYFDRNEQTTRSKHGITDTNIRLSCQILLTEELNGKTIRVL